MVATGKMVNGNAQIIEIPIIPGNVLASGEIVFAITSPIPEALIIPKIMLTKAMNGKIFLITISIVSRPA